MRAKGKVIKWFSGKGYGFLQSDDVDGDIYCTRYSIIGTRPYLMIGDMVEFDLVHNDINTMLCKEAFRADKIVVVKRSLFKG